MSGPPAPAGVILAGGRSSRMGADKAALLIDGRPMAVRVSDALWEAGCRPVVCQGGAVDALATLGLEVLPDTTPEAGPVAAICDAMARLKSPVFVAACDLPDLSASVVRAVILAGAGGSVSVAVSDGRRHLVSYWPRSSMATVEQARADGVTSYHDLLERVEAIDVAVASSSMRNVNRPGDLDARDN